jgi:tRNA modification GTPase
LALLGAADIGCQNVWAQPKDRMQARPASDNRLSRFRPPRDDESGLEKAIVSGSDTIYALSSGALPAAIAVVRISGPKAREALLALAGRVPKSRQSMLATVRDPQSGEAVDQCLVLFFEAPNSETGEDVVELQLHGGRSVVAATFAALARMEGLRPAEAGEFTRRAFENGKLDLTGVEALADLIHAQTEAQRRQAMRHLQGLLGNRAESWRQQIVAALALVEAGIDFSDEADVSADVTARALAAARSLRTEIVAALSDAQRGERLREGLVVAIAGPPNAGKSTLLNRIARREVAIVSPHAGTTRDVIEVPLDLRGYPVTLLDTAGIRDTDDPVEREGVARARARAECADLVLWLTEDEDINSSSLYETMKLGSQIETWIVRTKVDLTPAVQTNAAANAAQKPGYFAISAVSGEGIEALLVALAGYAAKTVGGEPALVTRERHHHLLRQTEAALARALVEGEAGREDTFAEELRSAATALGRLTGRVDVEDVLDVIFRDFCIGK